MIPWVPTVFEYLIDCYRIMQLNDQANIYQNTLDELKAVAAEKKANINIVVEMEKAAPKDFHHYVSNFLQS